MPVQCFKCFFICDKQTMRSLVVACLLVISGANVSQAQAFETLKQKFAGENNVFSISTAGFFARTILMLGGEHEFKKTIRDIERVRLITIPKAAFRNQHVTVNGFRNVLAEDSFESLMRIRDHGDDVSIYLQPGKRTDRNRYFILIENDQDVVAMEIKGYLDPERLIRHSQLSFND